MKTKEQGDPVVWLFLLGLCPVVFLVDGWSIQTMWNWFVAPLGVPRISLSAAMGLSLTAILFQRLPKTGDTSAEEALSKAISAIATLLLIVGLGWLVRAVVGFA